jgi:flagellin-like protein
MKFRENEDAVSPVIGVILMVAITVILAAVIAAFVFGMGSDVGTTKTVSLSSKLDGGDIVLTINGGPDLPSLQELTITVGGEDAEGTYYASGGIAKSTAFTGGTVGPGESKKFKVGETIRITSAGGEDGEESLTGRLLVVGKWSDGAEQIILDRTY